MAGPWTEELHDLQTNDDRLPVCREGVAEKGGAKSYKVGASRNTLLNMSALLIEIVDSSLSFIALW